jgi:hypothetical protein
MGNKRRLRKNKQRGMSRRLRRGKKPMCLEQKVARKKMRETQRAAALAANEAKKKTTEKSVKV